MGVGVWWGQDDNTCHGSSNLVSPPHTGMAEPLPPTHGSKETSAILSETCF
jgi:hypothetical protein